MAMESEHQDQIKALVSRLEKGEISQTEFQRLLDELVGAIGEKAVPPTDEQTVKREKLRQDAAIVRGL
jgi:polyhydroxyalkanoate synthesis regulator phasin